jgi:biopolymer transport protein ExbD
MRRREDRRDRWRTGLPSSASVNLISMMDILTVLVLFLLKSYVAGGEVMVPPPGIRLPASTAEQLPQSSLVVAIDGDEILVGSERVVSVADAVSGGGLEIEPLAAHLRSVRQRQDELAQLRGEGAAVARAATIQGDRNIEFRVLERVMFTLNRSGYEDIALAVVRES